MGQLRRRRFLIRAGEQPAKLDLVLNLKTEREIGIATPLSVRLRADRVIE